MQPFGASNFGAIYALHYLSYQVHLSEVKHGMVKCPAKDNAYNNYATALRLEEHVNYISLKMYLKILHQAGIEPARQTKYLC